METSLGKLLSINLTQLQNEQKDKEIDNGSKVKLMMDL